MVLINARQMDWRKLSIACIVILFVARLCIGITYPPIDRAHNWRQATTNMYARNFLEIDANILFARADHAGDLTGITAKEFPAFNYLIFLFSRASGGFDHWYGRLINLVVETLGLYFFFLMVRKLWNDRLAFFSSVFLGVSIWFTYGRMIIPDTFAASLMIIGVYYGLCYIKDCSHPKNLMLYFLLISLGMLSKIPSGMLGIFLIVPFIKWKSRYKPLFVMISLLSLGVVLWWYAYWIPTIVKTYGFEHHRYLSLTEGWMDVVENIKVVTQRLYFHSMYSFAALVCFLAGLITLLRHRHWEMMINASLFVVLGALYLIKAGEAFYLHEYYVIPLVPIIAIVAAFGINAIYEYRKNIALVILCITVVEALANQIHYFKIPESNEYKLELERIAAEYIPKEDLIVSIHPTHNPNDLYFLDRKGWSIDGVTFDNRRDSLIDRGAKWLIITPNSNYRSEEDCIEESQVQVCRL